MGGDKERAVGPSGSELATVLASPQTVALTHYTCENDAKSVESESSEVGEKSTAQHSCFGVRETLNLDLSSVLLTLLTGKGKTNLA